MTEIRTQTTDTPICAQFWERPFLGVLPMYENKCNYFKIAEYLRGEYRQTANMLRNLGTYKWPETELLENTGRLVEKFNFIDSGVNFILVNFNKNIYTPLKESSTKEK